MGDSLAWQPHPDIWLLVIGLLGGYFYALSAWGPVESAGRRPASRSQIACYCVGVATIWVVADWPVNALVDRMFSLHMTQHLVFSLVSAPLLLLGMPGWFLRRLLRRPAVQAVWGFATKPLIALVLFNGWIALYHIPFMVNLSVSNDLAHFLVHIAWLGFAIVLWWPVLSPLPEMGHLSYPGSMVYLFANSVVPTVPASFLTFGTTPLYRAYEQGGPMWGLSVLWDQQIAGLAMKIGGGLFLWAIIAALFFRWHAEEESGGPDLLYWRDVEPDFEQVELTKLAMPSEGGET